MIDPSSIRDSGEWEVYEVTPFYRRSRLWMEDGSYILRTETFIDEAIQEANNQARNATEGTRWSSGMGSEKGGNVPMIKVASIPMNKFMADFAGGLKEGDEDHAKWLLNSDAYAPFRTRKGRL